ncbi:glutathione S-transferase family protein [Tropicibacter sp. S64]|uniref:glutathione S-transferase family protein n=1 Tax=Tropicibacter sp. S64 TaxID=3415122 RepID=UPI003C7D665C
MTDLTFYTNPMSRGRIIRWMLEEVGASYDTVLLDYGPTMKTPDYLALNPMGKVPTLVHGDTVITECPAICCYLADMFPDAGLAPAPGSAARGTYYRWMFFAAGPLESAVVTKSFGFEVPDDPQAQGRAGWGSFDRVVGALEGLLSDGRDHLLGQTFSALDVYLGSQIAWGQQFGTLPKRPIFAEYAERIFSRPAAVRARALDDAAAQAGSPD